jgi:hypothetical protein
MLQKGRFENVLDSNIFSAYIARELQIPRVDDPRKIQKGSLGVKRYQGYVSSAKINQIFNYIGFIKRMENKGYSQYLSLLFQELTLFLKVMEDIVYNLDVSIPIEIYDENRKGLENFIKNYPPNSEHQVEWIRSIWKSQRFYLEHIDMLIETLKVRGKVFDFRGNPLYETLVNTCRTIDNTEDEDPPDETDICLIAESCVKAAKDGEPKVLWSGDRHVLKILKHIYKKQDIASAFPQIYLRSGYEPLNHARIFP